MSVMKVITKTGCPFCDKAKALLRESDISYTEVDVTNDEAYCEMMREQSLTVPRIWHGDVFVGGYVELCDYVIEQDMVDL